MRTKKPPVKAKTTAKTAKRTAKATRTRRIKTNVRKPLRSKKSVEMVMLRRIYPETTIRSTLSPSFRARLALLTIIAFLTLSATGGVTAQAQAQADMEDSLYQHIEMPQTAPSDTLFTPPSYLTNDIKEWTPMKGDKFEVNVETNMGRLVHENGESVEFEVVTGVRRVVRYIGRRYFAATPAAEWVVRETVIKRDRWTFGKTGRFIRLYKLTGEGEKRVEEHTPYGIHPFLNQDSMFRVPGRYGSMGCIILRESMVDIIQQTIRVNGGEMSVRTFPVMPEV